MDSVFCKQEKPLKVRILSVVFLMVSVSFLFYTEESILSRLLFLLSSLIIFGYSVSYKISGDFDNQKLFSVFGFPVFKIKLNLEYPDYISVFSTSFSLDNEWGAVSAIGTKERSPKIVVRFFTGNKNFTLYKTEKYDKASEKANELSELLGVEIYDRSKE
ncbi:hypothetical protein IWQ47_004605 [Aquimarina sp. EL_43]|uniref:hypothetical protein n=1 Tax=Aquimarina TaxID=290174 RepID=UPI0004702B93|nr:MULTISPECIES: hypothetical protein [Aquimarina]MBG6133061.1 hypothetical protein [Aquimarina sp. EL_35]MBG6153219.1 hypothetical protein [Aquimarina sp. EL_32]MBG6171512.1 hypothetical protein [Aquimarina sp. EL_43]